MTRLPTDETPFNAGGLADLVTAAHRPAPGGAILGELLQPGDAYLPHAVSENYYSWYLALGAVVRPAVIAETGVRYGYSLYSLMVGANWPSDEYEIWAFDDQRGGEDTLGVFEAYFKNALGVINLTVVRRDTQTLTTLGLDIPADLVHVDAHHTEEGCFHECELGWAALRPGGVLAVDDCGASEDVRRGFERFCRGHKVESAFLPTLMGMGLAVKPAA